MIKIGDKVNPTPHAAKVFGLDSLGVKFPCEVVNVFNTGEKTIAQFLCNDVYSKQGAMTLRSWDVRYLEPHVEPEPKPEKPRCKRVPVASLRVGDQVWSHGEGKWHTIGVLGFGISQKPGAVWEGSRYVWKKQTALQKAQSALFSTGRSDSGPEQVRSAMHIPGYGFVNGGGEDTRDAEQREGSGNAGHPPAGVSEPRATVRMTKGRDIKPGERISCVVAHDQTRKVNYFHAGPFGAAVLIEPDVYYLVVNDITK